MKNTYLVLYFKKKNTDQVFVNKIHIRFYKQNTDQILKAKYNQLL